MPYIKQEDRVKFNLEIASLIDKIENCGDLNFVFSELANRYVSKNKLCYATLNEVSGVYQCAFAEFQRRVVGTYEDTKIKSNGDIFNPCTTHISKEEQPL